MRLREVNEANFISSLHNVSVEKMDKLVKKKYSATMNRATEDTSKNESTEMSANAEKEKGAAATTTTCTNNSSVTVSLSGGESSSQLQTKEPWIEVYVPIKEREQVKNHFFKVDDRSRLLEVLIEDVIRVFEVDEKLDIFTYKSEDYIDDIRKLTKEESTSLDVKIAHDLMQRWVHYIKPPPEKERKKKKSRVFAQGKAHTSIISVQEVSLSRQSNDLKSGHMVGQSSLDTASE